MEAVGLVALGEAVYAALVGADVVEPLFVAVGAAEAGGWGGSA